MTDEFTELKADMAEEYARSVQRSRRGADNAADRLRECEEALDGLAAIRYDRDGGGSFQEHGDDRLFERLQSVEQAREHYADAFAGYIETVQEWDACLGKLADPRHIQVLTMRYVDGREWRDIAMKMQHSERMTYYVRIQALSSLYDKMPARFRLKDEPAV